MSNPAHPPDERERFVLTGRPPLRAYLVASACSMVGAVLVVLWLSQRWSTLVGVLALLVLVLGVALSATAYWMSSRFRTVVLVERDTVTLLNGRRRRVLNWTEIADVTWSGALLTFNPREGGSRATVLVDPRGLNRRSFEDLLAALRQRLDTSRGYRPL